jgi:hypothetical protein
VNCEERCRPNKRRDEIARRVREVVSDHVIRNEIQVTPTTMPRESEGERLNRNFAELLQEVRVAETGVQILFAFLLTLPFTQRFGDLGGRDVVAYAIAAVGAAIATVVLVAPVSFHRLTFREGRKPELVAFASVLALVGLIAFGVALVSAAFLIADVVLGLGWAVGFATLVAGMAAVLWFALPLSRRKQPPKRRLGTGSDRSSRFG